MARKPQQQTLSIRVSDTLREFLERSKQVISSGRGESVSTSDVAKILLESAKDDRLDDRLEVAALGRKPTESLVALRKKWEIGQSWSRAEWIFVAQYIQIACEELSDDPLAPRAESYAVLLEALLAVRGLRTHRGTGLDLYYLGNLDEVNWNDRTVDAEVMPQVVGKLIQQLRLGSGKKPVFVGRNFYVALRDEELQGIESLHAALVSFIPMLFRMAARGHWIREHRPVRDPRDSDISRPPLPELKRGDLRIAIQPWRDDVGLSIGFDARDLTYVVSSYPQIREFEAMLKALVPEKIWSGHYFLGSGHAASGNAAPRYQFQRRNDGVILGFTAKQWDELKSLFAEAITQPILSAVFSELSLIFGEL